MDKKNELTFIKSVKPAEITADFAAMKDKLDELLEPYQDMDDAALAKMHEKDVKACRADVNHIIKSVEDGRKAIKKTYNAPLKEFEDKVKELLAPAREASEQLNAVATEIEDNRKELKRQGLENSYNDYAPFLVPVVPFNRLLEAQWLNKSYSGKKACEELYAKVDKIADDWEQLKRNKEKMPFYQEAEAEFFRTLDASAALKLEADREAEQARIDELHAQVDAPHEEPQVEQEEPQQDIPCAPYTPPEHTDYVICVSLNADQKKQLIAFFKSCGIHGTISVQAKEED